MLLFKLCSCGKLTIIDKNAHTLLEVPSSQKRGDLNRSKLVYVTLYNPVCFFM
jgi:hypothetical protein